MFSLQKDLVIYEMNVRAFTAHESSGLDASIRGSYLGVIEKVGLNLPLFIQLKLLLDDLYFFNCHRFLIVISL